MEEEKPKKDKKKDKKKKKEKLRTEAFTSNAKDLKEGEYLEFDNAAYQMLHRATTEWPCLSVEFLLKEHSTFQFRSTETKKVEKSDYPLEVFLVGGS